MPPDRAVVVVAAFVQVVASADFAFPVVVAVP